MSETPLNVGDADDLWAGSWVIQTARRLVRTWQPWLGWSVLLCCAGLALLPGLVLWENTWLRTGALQGAVLFSGLLAVLTGWMLLGWGRPFVRGPKFVRMVVQCMLFLVLGLLVISQLLGNWLPSAGEWQQAILTRAWLPLAAGVREDLLGLTTRYAIWWQGVALNTTVRDDLILASLASLLTWLLTGLTVWLVRRFNQGLLAALPLLWPVGFVMLYSSAGRWIFVTGVALTLCLHLLLDQQRLVHRWQAERLDYSPSLLIERAGLALSGLALVLAVASVIPNLYYYDITAAYYNWLRPINEQAEAGIKRVFPGLTGAVFPGAGGGGMPNQFLLSGSPDLGRRPVMQVRTSEPVASFDAAPRGHNLRGMTFAVYDGRGWSNPSPLTYQTLGADELWQDTPPTGRRALLQSINLLAPTSMLFAADEPQAPSVDYRSQERSPGDLVALSAPARSYTIVSQLPALDEAALVALPAWDEQTQPLPPAAAIHLELPPSVTQRTRELAVELTQGITTPYGQAAAIEAYLRQFPYDLAAPAPPETATDVADFFLFDLQRGYCDYYATAFVVLARAVGLPARFATGFAPGSWLPTAQAWTVTEAEAHSWPEVYFPTVGWIPFEPTAGRPALTREGTDVILGAAPTGPVEFEPLAAVAEPDVGRIWFWLLLLAIAGAGAVAIVVGWRAAHEDPWLGLLRWGRRAGHPLGDGETPLEYGRSLAHHIQQVRAKDPELGRTSARAVQGLSQIVSAAQYAPEEGRSAQKLAATKQWQRLRSYLRRL